MSDGIFFDPRALIALESDIGKTTGLMVKAVTSAMEASGEGLRDEWRDNVADTSPGGALIHLPKAITSELQFGIGTIGVEVGPDNAKKQGPLGKIDEYGSGYSSAHMNGHKATDAILPRHERSLDAALAYSMRPVTDG